MKYFRCLAIPQPITPNSAAAERVFSLLKLFFGDARDTSLSDLIQSTLMLNYNKRATGHAE